MRAPQSFRKRFQAVPSVGQISESMSRPSVKNISPDISVNPKYKPCRLIPEEGRRPSSLYVGVRCGGRGSVRRFQRRTKRCPRTAKSCGPGAANAGRQVLKKLTLLRGDGDNKLAHRGEHDISRKAIAQGMSACSPLTCMLVCTFFHAQAAHTRPRVQRAPGIPCALCFRRRE